MSNILKRLILVCIAVLVHDSVHAQTKAIVANLDGEVDLAVPKYIKRAIDEAVTQNANVVVLRINTFGGRLDAATETKDVLLNSKLPVIAYIDKRAASAGAMIALSCSKIVMTPSSTMGAVTPVDRSGTRGSEKDISFVRSEMRSLAEHNKRNPGIAEAMVDENVRYTDSVLEREVGTLVTLTDIEAEKVGFCEARASSIEQALDELGYKNPVLVRIDSFWGETLLRVLTYPAISSMLIMLGLAGLFYGVKTGHITTVPIIGVCCIAIFFAVQYIANLADLLDVILFIVGLGLIAAEIFVIPGFGVAGVVGIVMVFASLFLALVGRLDMVTVDNIGTPLYTLSASMFGLIILVGLMFKYLPSSPMFKRLTLQSTARDAYTTSHSYHGYLGMKGVTVTILRPAGVALLNQERVDVISEGEFIPKGEDIEVVSVIGAKVVVRKIESDVTEKHIHHAV